ncbi:phosphoglycerate dehydrogenase [Planctomycetota bacterium]
MTKTIRVLVSTHPFAKADPRAAELIMNEGWELEFNPYGRKITIPELKVLLPEVDALIAGTEQLDANALEYADDLKLISRVGIGLDGIDWDEIKKRGIEVSYTPDAVTLSVAELTLGFMLSLARDVVTTNRKMHNKIWSRYIGKELSQMTIGIIGLGRVGKAIARLLKSFGCKILVNDIVPDHAFIQRQGLKLVDKEEIYRCSDVVTLHVPLTKLTRYLVDEEVFRCMKCNAFLINTSRGPVVKEDALYNAITHNQVKGAAIDVYSDEPYRGNLCELDRVILTCHMGSCTEESRKAMEIGAAQAVVDFFKGNTMKNSILNVDNGIHKEKRRGMAIESTEAHASKQKNRNDLDELSIAQGLVL